MSEDIEATEPQGEGHWERTDGYRTADWVRVTYGPTEKFWEVWVPKPELPTKPGLYYDRDGDTWYFGDNEVWQLSAKTGNKSWRAEDHMPFEFIAPLKKGE